MNRCLAAFLALLFASVTVSSTCFAEPNGRATRVVRYDDLHLSTPQGLKIIHGRIDRAAAEVCLDASGPSPGLTAEFICKADAARSARHQIKHVIAQQHLGKTAPIAAAASSPSSSD